jgi:acyl-[acyl-carrier-protein]-phospholipid O-acyltransferase/long-chain-fatty-acid--[acyl-carrier-protein] ligase
VETAINLFFAVGIAAGSLLAAAIAHGRIRLAPAPYLLLVIAAALIDLGLTSGALPQTETRLGLAEFFRSGAGLRVIFDILVLSAASGLFVVPIFAAVQAWAGADRRARVIGAVNTLNAVYMVGGSLATTLLLKLAGLSEPMALTLLGLANIPAALYLFWRLPRRSQ